MMAARSVRTRRPSRHLLVESLEDRRLLATYGGTGGGIADNGTTNFNLNVPDSIVIGDVNAVVDISHTRDSDLDVFLISPQGTTVELFTDVGGGGDNFAGTTLDDEASTSIVTGAAPFSGSYRPEGSLSNLDGENAQGNWTLRVTDDRKRQVGAINSWSIEVTSNQASLTIDDISQMEGDDGTTQFIFTVTRSGDLSQASSVDFATADESATASSGDYDTTSGTLNFGVGESAKTIAVNVNGDTTIEGMETFVVNLSNAAGAQLSDSQGVATIQGDDTTPTINFPDFSDPSNVTLVGDASITSNTLQITPAGTFKRGAGWYSEKQFVASAFETEFDFRMENSSNIGLAFVIQNHGPAALNDKMGAYGMPNSLIVEFDTGQQGFFEDPNDNHVAVITRGTSALKQKTAYTLGTATPSIDMNDGVTHSAKIAYQPGQLSVYVDDFESPLLTVAVDLLDTLDLDAGQAWVGFATSFQNGAAHEILAWKHTPLADHSQVVAIEEASWVEGDSGTIDFAFDVVRLGDTSGSLILDWSTADGTAAAGGDYTQSSGQIAFASGEVMGTITVPVHGDTAVEPNETFYVDIAVNSGSATVVDSRGVGQIGNDETSVSISDASATEGDSSNIYIDSFVKPDSGDLILPVRSVFGPDANADGVNDLYVATGGRVAAYSGVDGTFLQNLVADDPNTVGMDEAGGLENPFDMIFHTDGKLYVLGRFSESVQRFDPATGQFIDVFVRDDPATPSTDESGGLAGALGMTFGPDGNLYIVSRDTNEILRFDGLTGAFVDVFVDASQGLLQPKELEFGADSHLYVTSDGNDMLMKFDGTSGTYLSTVANGNAWGLAFGSSNDAYFGNGSSVKHIDLATGNTLETIGAGEFQSMHGLMINGDGVLYMSSTGGAEEIVRFGAASLAVFTVSLSEPTVTTVTVDFDTPASADHQAVSGTLTFGPGDTTKTIIVPTIDDAEVESNETFSVTISNPSSGSTISDAIGIGTILDNDTSNDPNALYVYDIRFDSKRGGKDWRAVVEIRSDSNADGQAGSNDEVRSGVTVTVNFGGNTYTGTTDANGVFQTGWIRDMSGGNHYANVVDLVLTGYFWDPLDLDDEDDSDGDGKPDALLAL